MGRRLARAAAAAPLLLLLLLLLAAARATALAVRGAVATPCADALWALQVAAYARSGALAASASVTANASFTLWLRPAARGGATAYVLRLLGAVEEHYHPIVVHADAQRVLLARARSSALHRPPPPPPPPARAAARSSAVLFQPSRRTRYALTRQHARWSVRSLWAYRLQALMVAAAAFIIWFPSFIRTLPHDVRAELLGHEQTDTTDPNGVFKALLAMAHQRSPHAPTSKRA